MRVEVVFAGRCHQFRITVTLSPGATVADALAASGVCDRFPNENIMALATGVWGHRVDVSHAVKDGDRVELYRPLRMDPREARRALAAHGKAMGQHDTDVQHESRPPRRKQ
jgi:putative ubiquitin-RnfH superfamily antitoxin RatB of RatAB toxin-antitoxin module